MDVEAIDAIVAESEEVPEFGSVKPLSTEKTLSEAKMLQSLLFLVSRMILLYITRRLLRRSHWPQNEEMGVGDKRARKFQLFQH